MKELLTVASFTIKDMIKRKSFIISNIIILLIIIVLFNVPNIMKMIKGDEVQEGTKLLIVDSQNIFEGSLDTIKEMELGYDIDISEENLELEDIKTKIENGETE